MADLALALFVAVVGGLVVALVGNLTLDGIRGVSTRIDARLRRTLRDLPGADRERWREELEGVLRQFEGRPLKQLKEGRQMLRAAERLVEVYGAPVKRGAAPSAAEAEPASPSFEGGMLDLRREFLKAAAEFLSYRELRVLELRYGWGGEAPQTAESVGVKFNVVPEVIDRIERQAIMKIESVAEAQKLREVPPAGH